MKENKEKQIKEIETIIKSNLAEGSFASAFAKRVAIQIVEYYQSKLPEDSVVLSSEELHERDENMYQVGITMGKKFGSKETTEKVVMDFYYELFEAPNGRVITYDSFCKIAQKHNVEIPRETFTLAELEAKQFGVVK